MRVDPKRSMNVLVISTSFFPKIDGMIRTVDNQCKVLAEAGNRVYLVNAERRRGHDDGSHPYSVRRANLRGKRGISLFVYPLVILRIYQEAEKICKQENIDVCLAYGNAPTICALALKLRRSIPVVESITDISSLAPHRGKNLDFRMAVTQAVVRLSSVGVDGYIFPTGYLRTQLERAVHMRFKKYAIIPDGVNVEKFSPRPIKEPLRNVVLYVGNLRKRKGLEDLISAAPTVISRVPDVRFVFVGEGLLDGALHRMVAQHRMEANFEFLGRVSEEALAEQYNRTNVYVVPTRFDGYPTSVLEAMAFAKPVVTTKDSVSDREGIVVDGKTGFLVDVGDSKRLSEVILSLLEDRKLAETLGLNARALVASEHGLEKVRSDLIRYLESFLPRSRGPAHPDISCDCLDPGF